MSDTLWPRGLQHAKPPCPSPTSRVHSNSCPLSRWCHQPSHSLSSPSPPTFNLSQYQDVFNESVLCIRWAKYRTSFLAQTVKRVPTMQKTRVRSLDREGPLEKKMAIHSSTLAWKIPWMEDRGRLQSMGSQRVGYDWETSLGQSIGVSASVSVFLVNIQDWFLFRWTGWNSLLSKGLSRVFSNTTV